MERATRQTNTGLPLSQIRPIRAPTVADHVFDELHASILSLELPPQTKISEAEVAKTMDVSRQPVREAFQRLAKLGFLVIRPQSGTTVSLISEEAVLRACFIRTALEKETCRSACTKIDKSGLKPLAMLLTEQQTAIQEQDPHKFQTLDDEFHREICALSGLDYVWELIHDSKGHMDRIRMLSLTISSQKLALSEHQEIFDAITAGDGDAAATCITTHLARIGALIEQIKAKNHSWFTDVTA